MNYQQAIDFIQSFPDAERGLPGIKPTRSLKMPLSVMKSLLEKMGNPQNAAAAIHITGSKGKGSTATFITSVLKQAGLQTALFTSPHIHSYTERIVFDGQAISEELFAKGIADLKPLIEEIDRQGQTVSTFGILTALFFHLVKAQRTRALQASPLQKTRRPSNRRGELNVSPHPAQWQVVEVGLGGKDDLTNVFEKKEVVVITPISLEHTAILGSTRSAIAENKAGIITPGCVVVLAPQADKDVIKIVRQICAQKEAQLVEVDHREQLPYPIQLQGEHQIHNAITALAVIEVLVKRKKIAIVEEAIKKGLAEAFLPGRFEIIKHGLASFAPTGPSCNVVSTGAQQSKSIIHILDGAHNGDSAQALAKTLHQVFPDRKVVVIIGVNQDKDLEAIWQGLKHNVDAVIATRSDNYRSMTPEEIARRIDVCNASTKVVCAENIDQALEKAKKLTNDLSVICICGSLYLVAEARSRLLNAVPETK